MAMKLRRSALRSEGKAPAFARNLTPWQQTTNEKLHQTSEMPINYLAVRKVRTWCYIERAKADGAMAALDEPTRPGKEPTIAVEAKTWMVALACRKPKDLGYPHEVCCSLIWLRMLLAHMTERLVRCDTFERAIWHMLEDVIALLGAE